MADTYTKEKFWLERCQIKAAELGISLQEYLLLKLWITLDEK